MAFFKYQLGIASYLMKLPNINARFADNQGRSLAMQLMEGLNEGTLKQLKFIGDNTNVDLKALNTAGMNVFHYLTLRAWSDKKEENEEIDMDYDEDEMHEEEKQAEETAPKEKRKKWCKLLVQCGEYLLSKGVDFDVNSESGSPLALSLKNGNKEFSLWLLKKGASIKVKDKKGKNILSLLIKAATKHGIDRMLKQIAEGKDSKKVLQEAAKEYTNKGESFSHKLARKLIKNMPDAKKRLIKLLKQFVSMELDFGMPLGMTDEGCKACKLARDQNYTEEQILKLSLQEGVVETNQRRQYPRKFMNANAPAVPTDKDKSNTTNKLGMFKTWEGTQSKKQYKYYNTKHGSGNVLHLIISHMDESSEAATEALKLLCSTKSDFDKKDLNGVTPLMLALLFGKQTFVELLLKSTFDPNSTNGEQKVTCLHLAAKDFNAGIVKRLIETGGKVDARDALENTAVHYAAFGRNLQTMEALIAAGADVNATNKVQNTPLHVSFGMYTNSVASSVELEDLMLSHKANINAKNKQLRTPFFQAFKSFNMKDINDPIELTMKVLDTPNYDLNMQDNKGNIVLHLACKQGTTLSVLTMIKAGAKLDIVNKAKNTPLAEALLSNMPQLCIYLLQDAKTDLSVYTKKKEEESNHILTRSEYKKQNENVNYEKHNVFWHAINLKDDGVLYMLRANGFPLHKAVKTAIKQSKFKLATKLFNSSRESLKNYVNKKDGMNLYCYFAYHCKKSKPADIEEFQNALIRAGVDPLSKSKSGITAIHAAAFKASSIILKGILNHMAADEISKEMSAQAKILKDSDIKYNPISILIYNNAPIPSTLDISGLSLELRGLEERHSRVRGRMRVAFSRRENSEGKETSQSCLAFLLQLCRSKQVKVSESIAFRPGDPHLNFANYQLYSHLFKDVATVDTTLFNYAVMLGNVKIAACLAGLDFSINEKDSEGRTALMYAVLSGKMEMVSFLLRTHANYIHKQKVKLNEKDKNGKTALMLCLEQAFIEGDKVTPVRDDILKALLKEKAQTDVKDNEGKLFVELLNKMPGNEAYVELVKKFAPSLKAEMNSYKKAVDVEMAEKPEYDFTKDCKTYLEKKAKKKRNLHPPEDKVKADPIFNMAERAEVVKGSE